MSTSLLSVRNIKKAFDGVYALKGVSFELQAGERLALVGENGAGKSTLMKILSGVWPSGTYEGEIRVNDKPIQHLTPLDARKRGISIIHQELCLFPQLSVAENLFLTENFPYEGVPGQGLFRRVHWKSMRERATTLFSELGFDLPIDAPVTSLSVAQRQLVEIARALHQRASILVLDEPTSALSQEEVEALFSVLKRMEGKVTLIYISHKLEEVFSLCDRIVVLRDGQSVAQLQTKQTDATEVIHHMVGRPVSITHTANENHKETLLEVQKLSHHEASGKPLLEDISFTLHKGEVLGVAGLMGSGRSELLRSVLGILPGERTGEIRYHAKSVAWENTRQAMDEGVAFVPEDRKKDGVFLDHSVAFNTTVSILNQLKRKLGILDLKKERKVVANLVKQMSVKFSNQETPIRTLSGGNQQKVLLARVVASRPEVLLLDEPTRGIDIGAKEELYEIIQSLVKEGISVILVSSELPEILALSDRVLVLREGKAMTTLTNDHLTQEQVMAYAAGENHATSANG